MNLRFVTFVTTVAATLLVAATAVAQNPDSSGDGMVKGAYYVREVLMSNLSNGAVSTGVSVAGVATFDGSGHYTFTGQGTSLKAGPNSSISTSGTYNVGSNGLFEMTSLADPSDVDYGGVSSVGPGAFVASATEGANMSMTVGIPIGSSVSSASFKGNYTAAAIDFPNANISDVRDAMFTLTANGSGSIGSVSLSGSAADQNNTALTQSVSGVTYSLSAGGTGTIDFGPAAETQLVSGTKAFYISSDGNIILGGSTTGYDMLVGIRSLTGSATNATVTGEFYMAAIEDSIGGGPDESNLPDSFYGSVNSEGSAGASLYHNRIRPLLYPTYDYTFDTKYAVSSTGTIPVSANDIPYNYAYGVSGANGAQAFVAIGDGVGSKFYSLSLGLALPTFTTAGSVYITPDGVVSGATFSPVTNPIAPGEWITIYGSGLASSTVSAPSLPLPTTLGNVQVTINGTAAPLDYVSATQIVAQVPTSLAPASSPYATIQVTNGSTKSNSVTVYTNDSAPGVFANPVATGPALAQHANYSLVTASDPAAVGETIVIYCNGLGAVSPAVNAGAAAPSGPLAQTTDPNVNVDYNFTYVPSIAFSGLTPGVAGLYQINAPVPPGIVPYTDGIFVDVGTTAGYTSMATISVSPTASASDRAMIRAKRVAAQRTRFKGQALKQRAPEVTNP